MTELANAKYVIFLDKSFQLKNIWVVGNEFHFFSKKINEED